MDAVRAVESVGLGRKDDFYWTLSAVFVSREEHREVFHQTFHAYWRDIDPELEALVRSMPAPQGRIPQRTEKTLRRVAEALAGAQEWTRRELEEELTLDLAGTWSDRETLRHKDFEQMSAEEMARAEAIIRTLRLPVRPLRTRRYRSDARGNRIDVRSTLRSSLRTGGELALRWRSRVERPPPLVSLCDISGSMERYSRVLLHFLHGLTRHGERVHTFLFGTRLTNVTRALRVRDVDAALAGVGAAAGDWSGGTRIGESLRDFNRVWARRVLSQGGVVLLITDGLDRGDSDELSREAARLRRSCRRVIWLNPLLRFDGFEPRAAGVRALLAHVDELRPAHNLESLEDLVAALSPGRSGIAS